LTANYSDEVPSVGLNALSVVLVIKVEFLVTRFLLEVHTHQLVVFHKELLEVKEHLLVNDLAQLLAQLALVPLDLHD